MILGTSFLDLAQNLGMSWEEVVSFEKEKMLEQLFQEHQSGK